MLRANPLKALVDRLEALPQHALVKFQLGFTRTPKSDTAFLSVQVGPAPFQPGTHVLQLCQFNLQLTFVTARTLCENIQDQPGAVQYPAFQLSFQVSFLAGRQGVVENHQLRAMGGHCCGDFFKFAGAYEIVW